MNAFANKREETGELVVTKGNQYDVSSSEGGIRKMGNPIALAEKYYEQGF